MSSDGDISRYRLCDNPYLLSRGVPIGTLADIGCYLISRGVPIGTLADIGCVMSYLLSRGVPIRTLADIGCVMDNPTC